MKTPTMKTPRFARFSLKSLAISAVSSLGICWPAAFGQDTVPPPLPGLVPLLTPPAATATAKPEVKPLTEGPLHEAFLSKSKDRAPVHANKVPPEPLVERPAIDPPSEKAQWIEGYWEWDPGKEQYIWVTGTWRVPPPGRFWVNGYWKRDDAGWYRVIGFWTDRKTDRIDYRKNGPPEDRPEEEVGESPGEGHFYIPGAYAPDGDGVAWRKGFWAKAQPGWSWVPAQWIRQPEGWVFQEGYWDRTLDDRGTLFAPATVNGGNTNNLPAGTVYQPQAQVSPQDYGLLNGAFGRPNANYDGYPGVSYDASGRYYGYGAYGNMGAYGGYLDYPYSGAYGYPYMATGLGLGYGGGGFGLGYGGYAGCGLGVGLMGGFYGGYPFWYPTYAYPGIGFGGIGVGLGFGGFGFGNVGFFGNPFWGGGWGPGWGWGGGWGGGRGWARGGCYPYYPGNRGLAHGGNGQINHGVNRFAPVASNHPVVTGNHAGVRSGLNGGANHHAGHNGVMAPPASHAHANPFHNNKASSVAHKGAGATAGHRAGPVGNAWSPGFNGVQHQATTNHTVARPAFGGSAAGHGTGTLGGLTHTPALSSGLTRSSNFGTSALSGGAMRSPTGLNSGAHLGGMGVGNGALPAHLGGASSLPSHMGSMGGLPSHIGGGTITGGASGNGYPAGTSPYGSIGRGSPYLGGSRIGGYPNSSVGTNPYSGGSFNGGHVGGASSAGGMGHVGGGHVGGFSAGGMGHVGGGHVGGFSAGGMGHVGGGGGHAGGGHR